MTAANQRIEIDGGVLKQQASLGRDSSGAFASAADGVTADLPQWGQQYGAQHGGPPPGLDLFTGEVVDHSVFATRE